MPWRETSVMEERLRFVARLLEGEGMSDVCRAFGISRKTGYKIFNRYKDDGLEARTDRSRRPVRYANQLPAPVEALIVSCRRTSRIGVPGLDKDCDGGEEGIRTLDTLLTYTPLAGERLRPLGHLSGGSLIESFAR